MIHLVEALIRDSAFIKLFWFFASLCACCILIAGNVSGDIPASEGSRGYRRDDIGSP